MASFTPSNLYVISVGSATLYVAHVDGSITSGTNYWDTGLDDGVLSVMAGYAAASTAATNQSLSCSFTASSGVIHTVIPNSESGTPYRLWVLAASPGYKASI